MQEFGDVITVTLSYLKVNVVFERVDKYETKLMSDFITVFDSEILRRIQRKILTFVCTEILNKIPQFTSVKCSIFD